jgi:transcriptional regulator with XRE-family HTH domain
VIDPSNFHGRLKEERKRLKLTQAEAAERCGVKRETWSRYETGALTPGMEVLAALAKQGADIHYMLTGDLSITQAQSQAQASAYAVAEPPVGPMARKKAKIKAMVDQIDSDSGLDAVQSELERVAEMRALREELAELKKKAG